MKNVRSVLRLYVVLLLLAAFAGCQAATEGFIEARLKTEAAAANKITPKEISDGVRLDSVSAEGKSMRFNYTMMDYDKDDLDAAVFYKNAKEELIKLANTDKDLAFFRKHKIKIAYAYYFKDGRPLSTIIIKAEDYK